MLNEFMLYPSFERCSKCRNPVMEILLNFTFVSAATRYMSKLREVHFFHTVRDDIENVKWYLISAM